MAETRISINSNNIINSDGFGTRKRWNTKTYTWDDSEELIIYRHAEVKGKRVYCRIHPALQENLSFVEVENNALQIDYESQTIYPDSYLELKMSEYLKKEIQKPKGYYVKGVEQWMPDPQFDVLKKQSDTYNMTISMFPENQSGEVADVAQYVYDSQALGGTEIEGFYLINDYTETVKLRWKESLFNSGAEIGSFILVTNLRFNSNNFFNSNKGMPRMKIEFEKFRKSGRYNASDGDFEAYGIGKGTIKFCNSSGGVIREFEVQNKPFKVEVRRNFADGNVGAAYFIINGSSGQIYVSDYPNFYIQYDINYWNQDSEVYLEGV